MKDSRYELTNELRELLTPVHTPLVHIEGNIYAKAENCQKTGSVKDRFVFLEVLRAIEAGEIRKDSVLVEATSGNTGISLSAAGAMLGLSVKIVMPENMSQERKDMMHRFGAEIIEVGPSDFTAAIEKRNELVASDDSFWSPMQFENDYNCQVHQDLTGPEIHEDMKEKNLLQWDFISGAGTGGTLMGIYRYIDQRCTTYGKLHEVVQVAPLEDAQSHGIQGINDGADFLLNKQEVTSAFQIRTQDAIEEARRFAKTHGMLIGISAGANIAAARLHSALNPTRNVVTLLCDRGERYFSIL